MSSTKPLITTTLPDLGLLQKGKVRDVYVVDANHLLVVATDRISAFDCVLPTPIERKGEVLTELSSFWFKRLSQIVPNHLITTRVNEMPDSVSRYGTILNGRSMFVRRTQVIPVECVVRGYLAGSGWNDYVRTGAICGCLLPPGMQQSERLPKPIFTPATKAETGHDENITESRMREILGVEITARLREISLRLYTEASAQAASRGIIIADTKFEFGRDSEGNIIWIDEALTPDSSRFWPADRYMPGRSQPSFDKQFVRDYLESLPWDKQPPAPALPPEIAAATSIRYLEAFRLITGREL